MSIATYDRPDAAELRLQRLEYRYRRAQSALAGAKALYDALRENPKATATQLHQALRQVEESERYLVDLQSAIELAEERTGK